MHNTYVDTLLSSNSLISDQVDKTELRVILSELCAAQERHFGSVVEFGCYVGTTSLFIRRLLDTISPESEFHVYDSFVGLPEKTELDLSPAGEQFKAGELAVSKKTFELQFKKAGLKTPFIHKGWFNDVRDADVPGSISFAYLDGDYYDSIKDSFAAMEKKLHPTSTIVVDDYANEALPGARKAVDEWLRNKNCTLRVESSLAIIRIANQL